MSKDETSAKLASKLISFKINDHFGLIRILKQLFIVNFIISVLGEFLK